MDYCKTIILKNGKECLLRGGRREDGAEAAKLFVKTHAQSDFLLSYPDECSFTAEEEGEYLEKKTASENEGEILAFVDGVLVGSAGFEGIGKQYKVRHRCDFGVSVDEEYHGLGIGSALLECCVECARSAGYEQMELQCVEGNAAAEAIYRKAGFVKWGENARGFFRRGGGYQKLLFMALDLTAKRIVKDGHVIVIRRETSEDFDEVENLVRESFWNVYRPGCLEHYVLKRLRDDVSFVPELDFVMLLDGRIIGQNVFVRAVINADGGKKIPIMTMGPICIAPEYKRKGYGKILLDHSLEKAAEAGCGALCFEGNIDFYGKSGFTYARTFGIRYHGLPEGADDSFFLCRELIPGYLKGVTGEYATPDGYFVCERESEEFEKYESAFPYKEKLVLPGQLGPKE